MIFFKLYIVGILVCFLISLIIEHLYLGNGRSETVHLKTIGENLLYSILSCIGVIGEIIFIIGEWFCGFDQKGQVEFLHDYEETLKQKKGRKAY